MGTGVKERTRPKASARLGKKAVFASAEQLREVLDELLTEIDADPGTALQLRSQSAPQRFVFPDLDLVLDVGPAEESDTGHWLSWTFGGRPKWTPALTLEMDSDVANRYLQGRENL